MNGDLNFLIIDMSTKTPMEGVNITLSKLVTGELIQSKITDQAGKVFFTVETGVSKYIISKPGFVSRKGNIYTGIVESNYTVELMTEPTTEQPPNLGTGPQPSAGESNKGRIGTSCSIISVGGFGTVQFKVRHDRAGDISGRYNSYSDAVDRANSTTSCFEAPPPAPKTAEEVGKEVGILSQLINGALGTIQDLTAGLAELRTKVVSQGDEFTDFLDGIWGRIEVWLIDHILDIIWAALTRPKKET